MSSNLLEKQLVRPSTLAGGRLTEELYSIRHCVLVNSMTNMPRCKVPNNLLQKRCKISIEVRTLTILLYLAMAKPGISWRWGKVTSTN